MKKPLIKEVLYRVKEVVTWQLKGFRTKN